MHSQVNATLGGGIKVRCLEGKGLINLKKINFAANAETRTATKLSNHDSITRAAMNQSEISRNERTCTDGDEDYLYTGAGGTQLRTIKGRADNEAQQNRMTRAQTPLLVLALHCDGVALKSRVSAQLFFLPRANEFNSPNFLSPQNIFPKNE